MEVTLGLMMPPISFHTTRQYVAERGVGGAGVGVRPIRKNLFSDHHLL